MRTCPGRVGSWPRGTPQQRPDPRVQLAHAEGLRHVVIGAALEGGDLVLLLRPGGEDEDRRRRLASQPPDDGHAVEIGQAKVEEHQVGPARLPGGQRLGTRCGMGHAEAVCSQVPSHGGAHVRVVLDDEDRGAAELIDHVRPGACRRAPGLGARRRQAGRRPIVGDLGLRRCDRQVDVDGQGRRARCGARRRDRASSRPDRARPPGRRRSRDGRPHRCGARGRTSRRGAAGPRRARPGPPSSTVSRTRSPSPVARAEMRMSAIAGAYLRAFSITLVRIWSMNVGSTATSGRSAGMATSSRRPAIARRDPLERGLDQVVELEGLDLGAQAACFDAAHVEEVGDQSVETIGLLVDRPRRGPELVRRPAQVRCP